MSSALFDSHDEWAKLATTVAARTLAWQQGCFYWGDAIAYDGLLALAARLDADLGAELGRRLRRWYALAPDSWDDALAPGAAAARLVALGIVEPAVLERIVDAMLRLPTTDGVPLLRPHVSAWRDLVWVDSLYHLPTTLAAAAPVLDRAELTERAVAAACSIVRVLRTATGIGHAYDSGLRRGTGVRWTRGVGWAVLGLLDLLAFAPEVAGAAGLDHEAARLLDDLAKSQRPDGLWPTVLERDDAAGETSVCGFWIAAAAHPSVAPLPTDTRDRWHAVSGAAARALLDRIDADGTVHGVSHDTHVTWSQEDSPHPATLPSPWGQGVALRALATLHPENAA